MDYSISYFSQLFTTKIAFCTKNIDMILRPINIRNAMSKEDNISSQIGMAANQIQKAKQKFDKDPKDRSVEDDLIAGLDFLVMAIRLYNNYRKESVN